MEVKINLRFFLLLAVVSQRGFLNRTFYRFGSISSFIHTEAGTAVILSKRCFEKVKNFASLFFNKVIGLRRAIKKDSGTGVFLRVFAEFLRTPFLRNTSGRLLLFIVSFGSLTVFYINRGRVQVRTPKVSYLDSFLHI